MEGVSRNEVKRRGHELFGLNSRYADDARVRAQAVLASQESFLEREIEETERKLSRARKLLRSSERKLARAESRGALPGEIEKLRLAVKGRGMRVAALERKLRGLLAYREKGTLPSVVFGGKRLWKRVCKGRASAGEWRAARKSALFSRGDETKGGNPNIRVSLADGGFRLSVNISHLSEQAGTDRLGRPVMRRAPRVEGRLWLPAKHRDLVRLWVVAGLPYSAELRRTLDGRLLVRLSFDLGESPAPDLSRGCLGVDCNPDGVGLCNVGPSGHPEPWPDGFEIPVPEGLGKYAGEFQVVIHRNGFAYVRVPELAYASRRRRDYLLGVLARAVVDAALRLGKPLALEDLEFGKDRLDTDRRFNRMASNFPYARMAELLCRRAAKERVGFKVVPPRHTSTIGFWKYADRHAVPVHCAAALVVGRRAMGFRERVTRDLRARVALAKQDLTQKVSPLPGEGQGMTRGVGAALERLERTLPLHNGLCPWRQKAFGSVWRDLRLLALALR